MLDVSRFIQILAIWWSHHVHNGTPANNSIKKIQMANQFLIEFHLNTLEGRFTLMSKSTTTNDVICKPKKSSVCS